MTKPASDDNPITPHGQLMEECNFESASANTGNCAGAGHPSHHEMAQKHGKWSGRPIGVGGARDAGVFRRMDERCGD